MMYMLDDTLPYLLQQNHFNVIITMLFESQCVVSTLPNSIQYEKMGLPV